MIIRDGNYKEGVMLKMILKLKSQMNSGARSVREIRSPEWGRDKLLSTRFRPSRQESWRYLNPDLSGEVMFSDQA